MPVQITKNLEIKNLLLLGVIFVSIALKGLYALTRDIFESGPDANGYIPFAKGFSEHNFFSPNIGGPPYYPSGYPFILSFLARLAPASWYELSQLLQIGMFSLAGYCFFYIVDHVYSWKIAGIATLIFCFNPAWAVVNSEAMYETLLVSCLIFSVYFLINPLKQFKEYPTQTIVASGALAGMAIAIHPRVIPLFLIVYSAFFLTQIKKLSNVVVLGGSTAVIPILFAIRNLKAKGEFTLMNSFWDGQTYNDFLNGCRSYACAVERIVADPIGFLKQSFTNGIEFWSPHSGPLMRGTWYHNISLLSYLNGNGYNGPSIYISFVFSIIVLLSWIYGTLILSRQNKFYQVLLFSLAGTIWLTDILVYGENRHRLVALIFMLPAHSASILQLFDKFSYEIKRKL
jgi:hypothetical protein